MREFVEKLRETLETVTAVEEDIILSFEAGRFLHIRRGQADFFVSMPKGFTVEGLSPRVEGTVPVDEATVLVDVRNTDDPDMRIVEVNWLYEGITAPWFNFAMFKDLAPSEEPLKVIAGKLGEFKGDYNYTLVPGGILLSSAGADEEDWYIAGDTVAEEVPFEEGLPTVRDGYLVVKLTENKALKVSPKLTAAAPTVYTV